MACRGCGHTRILMTADRAALVGHWSSRIRSDFTSGAQKGGLGHALNKAVLRCSNQWAVDDYDLHVNVDVDGKYCVRTGRDAARAATRGLARRDTTSRVTTAMAATRGLARRNTTSRVTIASPPP